MAEEIQQTQSRPGPQSGEISKRQVAYKVQINDILLGRYVKEDGWLPNYIETGSMKISRANIIGVVVSKDSDPQSGAPSLIIDDGSGKISLRFFDAPVELQIGEIVNVVGRPREFGSERYLVPEIIKKITDPKWVELRKLELTKNKQEQIAATRTETPTSAVTDNTSAAGVQATNQANTETTIGQTTPPQAGGLVVEDEDFTDQINPLNKVFEAIKTIDEGAGVGFDEIIVKTKVDEIDVHIKKLLEQGDIFEIRPGRYKILE